MNEQNTYTGTLKYKDIDFIFIFDKEELKLIPPKDKKREVQQWFIESLASGVYTFGKALYIKEILFGTANETDQKIIFIPSQKNIGHINSTLVIDIDYYIVYKFDRKMIDRISIKGPEITHIFPTTKALNKIDWNKNGIIGISTKPFTETTTEKEKFNICNKELLIYFGISISSSYKTGESPINLSSTMFIEFSATDDYSFIVKIIKTSRQFIQYLCYRKNIVFSNVELASPSPEGLHEVFATFHQIKENNVIEHDAVEKERLIRYEQLKGCIGNIINDIISNDLYLEHLPKMYELGRHIDAGRFVMITAAFEWEFKRNYPNGIKKDQKRVEAEERVANIIDNLIKENKGKSKEILKFLKKLISSDSLEAKIIQYGKDYNNVSDIFGNHLYHLNGEKLDYKQMGKRLSDQRNNFAHGNIDKEFDGLALLDLMYLERIVYILQLKSYGLNDDNVKYAINDLFRCNLAL